MGHVKLLALLGLLSFCLPAHADVVSALYLLGTWLATATTYVYVGYALMAASAIYGATSARKKAKRAAAQARAEYNASLQDRTVSVLRADPPWRVIYGECVVGGTIVDIFTTDNTSSRNEDGSVRTKADGLKHMVIVLANHECQEISECYLDGIALGALDAEGWATSAEADAAGLKRGTGSDTRRIVFTGSVTPPEQPLEVLAAHSGMQNTGSLGDANDGTSNWTPQTVTISGPNLVGPVGIEVTVDYRVASTGKSSIRIGKNLGSDTQVTDPYLAAVNPTRYTANHRLRGLCYVSVTLDLEDQRFQGGPPNLTFKVKGRKVFDPRDSQTRWTRNPALIVRDYLIAPWGGEMSASEVNNAYVIAAANVCDEPVSLTIGGTTETNQPRYTCDGMFTTEGSAEAILDDLLESMAGFAAYSAEWQIVAGSWTAPVMTLGDDDVVGQVEVVQADVALEELANGIRGQYVPANTGTPVDYEPYSNAVFVTEDGRPLWTNNDLPFTNHKARARNLARIGLERSRNGQVLKFPAKIRAWPLQIGDRVTVNNSLYSITSKTYRVTDWQFGIETPVTLILEEDTASTWDLADATVADPTPNTDLNNPWKVAAVSGITATSGNNNVLVLADGSVVPRVRVEWAAITDALVVDGGSVEVLWRYAASISWEKIVVAGSERGALITGAKQGRTILIEVRAVNTLDVTGPSSFLVHAVTGKTSAPGNVTSLAHAITAAGIRVSWDRNTEVDYEVTELSVGSSYAGSTVFWRGNASDAYFVPSAGTYTVWAVHVNTSGLKSATPASTVVTGYSPSTAAQILNLTSTGFAFIFDDDLDTSSDSPTISFTANLINVSGTATFTAEAFNALNGSLGTFVLGGSGNTRTMTAAQFNSLGATSTRYVRVTATLSGLSDSTTVYRGDGGSDSIVMVLDNEAHTVPTASDGTGGVFTGALTKVDIYRGLVKETSSWTHAITVSGCTATINGNAPPGNVTGADPVTVAVTSMSTDAAIVTITSSRAGNPTQTKVFSLAKSKTGVDPVTGYLTNESTTVPANSDGTGAGPFTNAGGTFKVFRGNTELTTGGTVAYSITGGTDNGTNWTKTQNGLTLTIQESGGSAGNYSLSGTWTSASDVEKFTLVATVGSNSFPKEYTITKARAGAVGSTGPGAQYVKITGEQAFKFLANQTVPTATSIVLSAQLFNGLTTYDWEYWTGSAWTNLSGTQNAATYTLDYNNTAWGSASSLRIRCQSGSQSDEITVVKLYDANEGVAGYLTNENITVPANNDGTGADLTGASGSFKIFRGVTDSTTSAVFAIVGGTDNGTNWTKTQNGLTLTIQESGGSAGNYSLSGTWTSATNSETFTMTGTFGGVTISKVFTVSKSRVGAAGSNGTRTARMRLYQWSTARPTSFPSGSSTYTWADGTFTLPATLNGWSLEPGVSSGGAFLWIVEQVGTDTTTNATTSISWTSTTCFVQGSAAGDPGVAVQTAVYAARIYLRQASKPAVPTGGTFNFETQTLSPPAGWSATEPSRTTTASTPTWVADVIFVSENPYATVTAGAWSDPTIGHENDGNGAANNVVELQLFALSATLPVAPTATTATYNFNTATFTAGNLTSSPSWGTTRPAATSSQSVYRSSVRLSTTSPGTDLNITAAQPLSAPTLVERKGVDSRAPLIINAANFSITGVAYSDGYATRAIRNAVMNEALTTTLGTTTLNKLGDQVTMTFGTTTTTRTWNGSSWGTNAVYFPGDVLSGGVIGSTVAFNTDGYIIARGFTSTSVVDPSTGSSTAQNVAIAGNTSNNARWGVYGSTSDANGAGVYGYNSGTTSNHYGVKARGGSGVEAYATNADGWGIHAYGRLVSTTGGGGAWFEAAGTNAAALKLSANVDPIGGGTAKGLTTNGVIESTLATGTAPFTVASTTKVANLHVDQVDNVGFGAVGGGATAAQFSFNYPGDVANQTNTYLLVTISGVDYYIPIWKKTA